MDKYGRKEILVSYLDVINELLEMYRSQTTLKEAKVELEREIAEIV